MSWEIASKIGAMAKGAYDARIGLLAASVEALDAEGHCGGRGSTEWIMKSLPSGLLRLAEPRVGRKRVTLLLIKVRIQAVFVE